MITMRRYNASSSQTKGKPFFTLQTKLIGLIGALAAAIILLIGIFLHYFVSNTLEAQISERALDVAHTVALIPEIAEAFSSEDPAAVIQPIVQNIQRQTGAEFIVVGNQQEIRYAHPNPERIGQKMAGEDNERALLYGESYISESTGSLGNSLRAKVPIYADNEIAGVVSVGFLAESIDTVAADYSSEIRLVLLAVGAAAILGAVFIAKYIKRTLFGLEPVEISHLLFQKETILHSIHEGIVAVDADGQITMINSAALKLLTDSDEQTEDFIGRPIADCFPNSNLPDVLISRASFSDQEKLFGSHIVYVNSVPIFHRNELLGAVSTFRNKTEIENLLKELAHMRQYANALRAQTHEFTNKLYTIMGLSRLGRHAEVLQFIQSETAVQQQWMDTLLDEIDDPYVSGLLVGKLNQASELQIHVTVAPGSRLQTPLSPRARDALLTAAGNLLDNAFDAVSEKRAAAREIAISFTDLGPDILFEVDDAGPGIDLNAPLFSEGFSTKEGAARGFGLALTKQAVEAAGGELFIEPSELGGAYFVVSIPKDS